MKFYKSEKVATSKANQVNGKVVKSNAGYAVLTSVPHEHYKLFALQGAGSHAIGQLKTLKAEYNFK